MIVLALFLTVVVYLAFPVIYITTVDKVPENIAKKYALINSIAGAAVFMLLRVLTGSDAMGAGGFAPAVLYYFIAKAILTKKEEKTNPTQKQNTQENQENVQAKENKTKEN